MAKKALTRKEASDLRDRYLEQRQELLQAKVDDLGIKLYDKIFNNYLSNLEQVGGVLVFNNQNLNMIQGLDAVYKNFRDTDNAKVIKTFVSDAQGIPDLNDTYFKVVQTRPTKTALSKAITATNKGLGVTKDGNIIKNGFTDKFLRDETLLKKIKTDTVKALTDGKGFQQFREELKVTIQGVKGEPLSGGLQQYYRNNAYDTMQKVDRLASEAFADELGMQYFIWTGGRVPNSRAMCILANGKIVDSAKFRHLTYEQLKKKYQPGIPHGKNGTWHPLEDLGGFGCIHRKDYIDTELALQMKDNWLNIDLLKK